MRALARAIQNLELPAVEKISQHHQDPFEVLIATMLSAQTRDPVTAAASERLFRVAATPGSVAKLPEKRIARLIYPVSFYRNKARHVKATCRLIVERFPGLAVVFLTVYEDEQYVFEALRAGAKGYMLKRASAEDIVRVLRGVRAGRTILDEALTGDIALRASRVRPGHIWPGSEFGITQRESEVLRAVVDGLNNKAIAEQLVISEDTVKTHVRSIFRKLGVTDRAQAVSVALRESIFK